jgi:hypothetical protein
LILEITKENRSGRRGSNSHLSAWEGKFSFLYFQYLQNCSATINPHATHTVDAMHDLRILGGRFGGRSFEIISRREVCYLVEITEPKFLIRRAPSRNFEISKAESHHSV